MPTESNRCFGLVIIVVRGETESGFACSESVSGLWLDVEEETSVPNN